MGLFKRLFRSRSVQADGLQSPQSNPISDPYGEIRVEDPFFMHDEEIDESHAPMDMHPPSELEPVREEEWELYQPQQYLTPHGSVDVSSQVVAIETHGELNEFLPSQGELELDSLNEPEEQVYSSDGQDYLSNSDYLDLELDGDWTSRSPDTPETEMVAEIAPPSPEDDEKGRSVLNRHMWNDEEDEENGNNAKVFHWGGEEYPHTLSERATLALLPIAVPSPLSTCSRELDAIEQLRAMPTSETRDTELISRYERYLTLVPNDMQAWSELSEFLIETRGLEVASDRIRSALGTVRDDTPLLLQLAEIARRACDFMIAARYVEHAVRLQPHNIEVLTMLRDVQMDNKLIGPAQETEALINHLLRGHLPTQQDTPSGEMGELV